MTDRDQTVIFSLNGGNGDPNWIGIYDDFAADESQSADFVPSLVSLGFIRATVRRGALLVSVMAILGLIIGFGIYREAPHNFQASASVLITSSPYDNSLTAAANNEALAETRAVAAIAVHDLGLQENAGSFLSTYSALSVTDRLLNITASARSSSEAVVRASALANAFLQFRASELQAEQNVVLQSLNQQANQGKERVNLIAAQISRLSSQPTSSSQQSRLKALEAEQTSATGALATLENAVTGNEVTTQPAMAAAVKASEVLSVAPISTSRLKPLLRYAAVGLIAGLGVGLAIVILRALVSDRLRQRDDIAAVLDAPVKLSVGSLAARRLLPTSPGRAARRVLDLRRVVAYLQTSVPRNIQGPARLAIVAVDNAPMVAQAIAALASSYGSQGHQVVVADLSRGSHLARLLGVRSPGAHAVSRNGVNFMIAVPDRDDATPIGPIRTVTPPAGSTQAGDLLAPSYTTADLLLTLVTLDPALGGDHLATWATNAVVVVSAGQSSAARIYGVGEMIRLAGTRLDSVVLVGADKADEGLGLARRPGEQAGVAALGL